MNLIPACCPRRKVVELDHGGAEAARGGVEGAARARRAAADDQHVEVVALQRRKLSEDQDIGN